MKRSGWILFGGIGGASLFAFAGLMLRSGWPSARGPWGWWLVIPAVPGFGLGRALGGWIPSLPRPIRLLAGAVVGAATGAAVFGSLTLLAAVLSGGDPFFGYVVFVSGAALGAFAGVIGGGLAAWFLSPSDDGTRGDQAAATSQKGPRG